MGRYLSVELRFERRQHLVEKGGGPEGGGHGGIKVDERGQRAVRRNIVVREDRLECHAGSFHCGNRHLGQ